jgi:proteic killer suppression protein
MPFSYEVLASFFGTVFAPGSKAGIRPQHADRLRLILGRLNVSNKTLDMNFRVLELHALKGDRKGFGSVKVSGNGKNTDNIGYEDYHGGENMAAHDPRHPGEVLRKLCIVPLGLTVTQAAFGVSRKSLLTILNGRARL